MDRPVSADEMQETATQAAVQNENYETFGIADEWHEDIVSDESSQ